MSEDFNGAAYCENSYKAVTQGKKAKKGYGQGRSIIHANVAEALKLRQVINVAS